MSGYHLERLLLPLVVSLKGMARLTRSMNRCGDSWTGDPRHKLSHPASTGAWQRLWRWVAARVIGRQKVHAVP